jgi:hypothetical protein
MEWSDDLTVIILILSSLSLLLYVIIKQTVNNEDNYIDLV